MFVFNGNRGAIVLILQLMQPIIVNQYIMVILLASLLLFFISFILTVSN